MLAGAASRRPVGLKAQIGLIAALLAILAAGAFVVMLVSMSALGSAQSDARKAQQLVAGSDALLNSVLDLETGERAFALTREEMFLEPWRQARAELPGKLRLEAAVVHAADFNGGNVGRFERLRRGILDYLNHYSLPLVAAIRNADVSHGLVVRRVAEGKRLVDQIRARVGRLKAGALATSTAENASANRARSNAVVAVAIGLATTMALILGLVVILSRTVASPVRRVARAAARLAGGDLSVRVPPGGGAREVSELSDSFNSMAVALAAAQHQLGLQNNELSALLQVRTRELDQARLEAFNKLALAGEYRDDETREHTHRVGEVSAAIARSVGLDEAMVEIIRRVAPLHDLGKIGIPDEVLLKPGRLTEAEFAAMKEHARIGAEIFSGSDSPLFLIAAQIAGSHHERWDGSGYPQGLVGAEIPVAARIVGLADAFDAMTHERPYKAAWPLQEALAEIERCRGTHFDPELADTFARLDHSALLRIDAERDTGDLATTTWKALHQLKPLAGLGVSAADERAIAGAFRESSRALLVADDQRRYVRANKAACRLLGVSSEELIGKRIDDFTAPDLQEGIDAAWSDFLRTGTSSASFTLVRANGSLVAVNYTALAHFVPGRHLSILEPADSEILRGINDPERLRALAATELMDSAPEESYDRLTRLVARALNVPVALISLVDDNRQFFKSQIGLSEPWAEQRQTPLSHSFCKHTIATQAPLVINDAHQHPDFQNNPAIEELGVTAYAGVPITTQDGHVLGSLCAIDNEPHEWTPEQIELLELLSSFISEEVRSVRGSV